MSLLLSETWVNMAIYRIQDRNITTCRYKVTSQVVRSSEAAT